MMTQTMRKPRPLAFVKPVKRISKKEDKGIYFSPYEWEVFSKELELGRDIKTALHNAHYYGELKRRADNLEAGQNVVTFSEEEFEAMINESNI